MLVMHFGHPVRGGFAQMSGDTHVNSGSADPTAVVAGRERDFVHASVAFAAPLGSNEGHRCSNTRSIGLPLAVLADGLVLGDLVYGEIDRITVWIRTLDPNPADLVVRGEKRGFFADAALQTRVD